MNCEQPLNSRSKMDLGAKGGITYDEHTVLTLVLETYSEVICSQHF